MRNDAMGKRRYFYVRTIFPEVVYYVFSKEANALSHGQTYGFGGCNAIASSLYFEDGQMEDFARKRHTSLHSFDDKKRWIMGWLIEQY